MKKIYFDESGYTGDNLLNANQQTFSYGSVCIDESIETSFIQGIVKEYNIQGGELKGSRLLKSSRGRKALKQIIERYSNSAKVCIHDKRYALAAHIFEFIMEPVASEINSYLYNSKFHLYIANMLYVHLKTKVFDYEKIFNEFEVGITSHDLIDRLDRLGLKTQSDDPCRMVFEFGLLNRTKIEEELHISVSAREQWQLDLSLTSLYSLLTEWGQIHSPIYAVCDESKPLAAKADVINIMVGRTDNVSYEIMGEEVPLTFNLAQPVEFGLSKNSIGIQIADCFAAIGSFCYENGNDDFAKYCIKYIGKGISPRSIWPQIEKFDVRNIDNRHNLLILMELIKMARNQEMIDSKFPYRMEMIRRSFINRTIKKSWDPT